MGEVLGSIISLGLPVAAVFLWGGSLREMWKHFIRRGGESAGKGAYWCVTSGEFVRSAEGGDVLPGGPDDVYVRVYAPLMLLMTPILVLPVMVFRAVAVRGWRFIGRRAPTGAGRL
jgi:hypothetical protein